MFPYLRALQQANPYPRRGVDTVLIRYLLVREDEDPQDVIFNSPMRIFLRQQDARSYHAGIDNEFAYTIFGVRLTFTALDELDAR